MCYISYFFPAKFASLQFTPLPVVLFYLRMSTKICVCLSIFLEVHLQLSIHISIEATPIKYLILSYLDLKMKS